jgi:hypothetical protein
MLRLKHISQTVTRPEKPEENFIGERQAEFWTASFLQCSLLRLLNLPLDNE